MSPALTRIDKSKALSLLLHAADISHPTKQWSVHSRWTKALMEEFFRQVAGRLHPRLPPFPLFSGLPLHFQIFIQLPVASDLIPKPWEQRSFS